MSNLLKLFPAMCLLCLLAAVGFGQVPAATPTEEPVTVDTEEIRMNVTVRDVAGRFVPNLKKEDLVIVEDGRLQQPSALRRTPASVMLLLDTGGAMRTNLSATRAAAKRLTAGLAESDAVSVVQFGDKVDVLSGWTSDKTATAGALDNKLAFGRRNVLNRALGEAVKLFGERPPENRHLVLITGGIDSFNDEAERASAIAALMGTDINVHVISYTVMEKRSAPSRSTIFKEGELNPRRMPEEIADTLPDPKRPGEDKERKITTREQAKIPRLGSVTLDVAGVKKARADAKELAGGQQFLETLAGDTNGLFLLPESVSELEEKANTLAELIASQYVVAYVPKRPLKESPAGEVRRIEVTSRLPDVTADAHRKLLVRPRP